MVGFMLGYSAAQRTARRSASMTVSAESSIQSNRIEDLRERVDSLAIIVRGMWALMEEQGMTTEQLMAKIDELDKMDGVPDGLITPTATDCPQCESKVAPGLTKCQFCGADVGSAAADDPLDET